MDHTHSHAKNNELHGGDEKTDIFAGFLVRHFHRRRCKQPEVCNIFNDPEETSQS